MNGGYHEVRLSLKRASDTLTMITGSASSPPLRLIPMILPIYDETKRWVSCQSKL
jgi:hypothetical protein